MKALLAIGVFLMSVTAFGATQESADDMASLRTCREGSRIILRETDANDNTQTVWYVCKNGKYVRMFPRGFVADVSVTDSGDAMELTATCREGSTIILHEQDPHSDRMEPTWYVCRSGKWVPLYPRGFVGDLELDAAQLVESVATCREGSRIIILEPDTNSDRMEPTWYVCQNGKWVPLYPRSFNGEMNFVGTEETFEFAATCREGSTIILRETDENDNTQTVWYVCRGGKWVKKF